MRALGARELLTFMMEDAHNVYRATRLQSIAKYLERMADHTTNQIGRASCRERV